MNPIEIWDNHSPLLVWKKPEQGAAPQPGSLDILISHEKPELPPEVEEAVHATPVAVDAPVAWLVDYKIEEGRVSTGVFTAGFSYNQYLNRSPQAQEKGHTAIGTQAGYDPFASWILPVTADNQALFWRKKGFGVSALGGFTDASDIEDRTINPQRFLLRKLKEEMPPEMYDALAGVEMIGLDYLPRVQPKGFDGVYIVRLVTTLNDLREGTADASQFEGKVIPVPAEPDALLRFLENPVQHEPQWKPSVSCVGGVLNYIGATAGYAEMERARDSYSQRERIHLLQEPPQGAVRALVAQAQERWTP